MLWRRNSMGADILAFKGEKSPKDPPIRARIDHLNLESVRDTVLSALLL